MGNDDYEAGLEGRGGGAFTVRMGKDREDYMAGIRDRMRNEALAETLREAREEEYREREGSHSGYCGCCERTCGHESGPAPGPYHPDWTELIFSPLVWIIAYVVGSTVGCLKRFEERGTRYGSLEYSFGAWTSVGLEFATIITIIFVFIVALRVNLTEKEKPNSGNE